MADMDASVSAGPEPMNVGSQLCTQCGLCCTGALHDTASAAADEIDALRERGMNIVPGEKAVFSLPCPCLRGTSCGIYQDRPRVCSRYRCQLLRDVEAGTAEPAEALLKVREARRLYEAVMQLIPPGMSLPEVRALSSDLRHAPQSIAAEHYPVLMLRTLALMRYIDQHFRHSDEGPLLGEEILTMGGSAQPFEEGAQEHV